MWAISDNMMMLKTHKLKHSDRLFIACNACYIQNHNTFTHVSSSLAYTRHMHGKRTLLDAQDTCE